MWVGGCVTAPMAWPSPPGGDAGVYTDRWKWPLGAVLGHLCTLLRREDRASRWWGRRSVHGLAKTASRRRFGAFVYTVAPLRTAVATQECTQIGQNGLSTPFWGICVHCCAVVDRRGDAGVYTDWPKWPLDTVLGHLCTLLRRCGQTWGRRSVHRLAKTASRRRFGAFVYTVAPRFAEASTHTNPRRARDVPRLEKSTRSASGPLRARQAVFKLVHQQPDVVHGGFRLGVQV